MSEKRTLASTLDHDTQIVDDLTTKFWKSDAIPSGFDVLTKFIIAHRSLHAMLKVDDETLFHLVGGMLWKKVKPTLTEEELKEFNDFDVSYPSSAARFIFDRFNKAKSAKAKDPESKDYQREAEPKSNSCESSKVYDANDYAL